MRQPTAPNCERAAPGTLPWSSVIVYTLVAAGATGSLVGRQLGAIDDDDLDWTLCRIQLETELLLNGREQRRAIRIDSGHRWSTRRWRQRVRHQLVRRPRELDIIRPLVSLSWMEKRVKREFVPVLRGSICARLLKFSPYEAAIPSPRRSINIVPETGINVL